MYLHIMYNIYIKVTIINVISKQAGWRTATATANNSNGSTSPRQTLLE